ncbi:hypothetical protein Dtox_3726 [Desulfofarcimen acetoxidans DSM 771]|uniref:Conjugal transfer protein TrbC n=1 Tax=Desulfofarcimen acetoxidans (strain ATCC 49208 / DSM 771 / KCTC 5769 / VKM B-1644 / 5575) TaxID=485916 RepID=C8VWS0_DESAS|nr:hypothetical protein [Desulfofarcimen acetoxidans]ACV64434.1 hypothetical protein Dtox_3726 [Desulfofarcimen acetoxidans DSM 771]
MTITGFYVSPKNNFISRAMMTPEKGSKLQLFCASAFMAMSASPAHASTGTIGKAALSTFGQGGPGIVIVQMMLIACVGWLSGYIAQAVGQGQIAGMIKITTVFSCIGLVAGTAFKAITTVANFLG